MPIDLHRAEAAVKSGLAFPCALCEKYWEGRDRGLAHCGVELCGGPRSGKSFPQYRGPLPPGNWPRLCFRCGDGEKLRTFKVIGTERILAACLEHVGLLETVNSIFLADLTPGV